MRIEVHKFRSHFGKLQNFPSLRNILMRGFNTDNLDNEKVANLKDFTSVYNNSHATQYKFYLE